MYNTQLSYEYLPTTQVKGVIQSPWEYKTRVWEVNIFSILPLVYSFLSGQLYLAIINNGIRGIIETVDIDILTIINILIINHLKKN